MKNYITLPDGRRKTCKIYDSGPPFHPQGIGQHGELIQKPGRHLGKRIAFEQLPEDCQKAIIQDLT